MITTIKSKLDYLLQNYLRLKIRPLRISKYSNNCNRYSYQRNIINFKIEPTMKVLDIGSGSDPFPFATHLVDKFPHETTHRTGLATQDERPFF